MYTLITILVLIVLFLASAIRVLAEYERGITGVKNISFLVKRNGY